MNINKDLTNIFKSSQDFHQGSEVYNYFSILLDNELNIDSVSLTEDYLELGVFKQEIIPGTPIFRFLEPSIIDDFIFFSKKAFRGEKISICKKVNKNGLIRNFQYTYEPVVSQSGDITFIKVTALDVEIPLESENNAETPLLEQAGIPIFSANRQGLIRTWNNEACRVFGYAKEEIKGENLSLLFSESVKKLEAILKRSKKSAKPFEIEALLKDRSGRIKKCNLSVSYIAKSPSYHEEEYEFVVINQNKKNREGHPGETLKKITPVINGSSEPILVVNSEMSVVYYNKIAEWFFESKLFYQIKVGESVLNYFPTEDAAILKQLIHDAFEGKIPANQTGIKGASLDLYYFAVPEVEDGGIFYVILFFFEDTSGKVRFKNIHESGAFSAVLNNTNDAVFIMDKDLRVTHFNQSFIDWQEKVYNLKVVSGLNLLTLIPPAEEEFWTQIIKRGLGGERFAIRYERFFNGKKNYYKVSFNPIYQNGEVTGVAISSRDITARKNSEEALFETESKFKSIVEQASVGIVIVNMEFEQVLVNNKFCEIIGYTREEFSQLTVADITHPDDFVENKIKINKFLSGEIEGYFIEKRYIHKNGHIVWVELNFSGIRGVDNERKYGIAIVHDISHRKVMEAALTESELKFRSIFEHAAVGMTQIDMNLKWVNINDKFCEIVGYSREELANLNIKAITYPEDYLVDLISLDKLLRGHKASYTREKRYIHKLGHIVWVSVTVSILRDSSGKTKYFISIVQDINSRKKAEQELIFKNNELDTFLYRASHDLKGPISSLLGICSVVQMEVQDKTALGYFNWVADRANRMNNIILNLAELGKIKEADLRVQSLNFGELIEKVFNSLSSSANYHKIDIQIKNNSVKPFFSDENIVFIILHNLLDNAVRYMDSDTDPYILIEVEDVNEAGTKITISDNGMGIDEDIQDKIFNMFFRGTDKSKGSGLGLYIAKNAVEKLKGTIQLINKYQKVTCFTLFLPNLKK